MQGKCLNPYTLSLQASEALLAPEFSPHQAILGLRNCFSLESDFICLWLVTKDTKEAPEFEKCQALEFWPGPLWAAGDTVESVRGKGLNGASGQRRGHLSAPFCPTSKFFILSPGSTRDMQPTMKFVMDTSKFWFKPSITREQGNRKLDLRAE